MKLSKLYTETIEHLPRHIQENLIKEAPHTRLHPNTKVPKELQFIKSTHIDLGFENLGLTIPNYKLLLGGFSKDGLKIPGTKHRIRQTDQQGVTVIEPATGMETPLPNNWKQAVLTYNYDTDTYLWIGKRVRPEQYGGKDYDFSDYQDQGDGYAHEGLVNAMNY